MVESLVHEEILDQMSDGVYVVDRNRIITYWNRSAEKLSGFPGEEVIGTSCADNVLRHVSDKGTLLCMTGCPLAATINDGEIREAEVFLHHKDGHRLPVLVRTAPLREADGRIVGAVEIFRENAARIAMREEIQELSRLALYEPLTGIGNRRFAEMALESRQAEFERYERPYGVLMIDIDHFKSFNDNHGHDVGDRILRVTARTLNANTRPFDTVARWGGEEFIGIIEQIDPMSLRNRADVLCRLVESSSILVGGNRLSITASIGGAVSQPGDNTDAVVKRADNRLYQSKNAGRNRATCS